MKAFELNEDEGGMNKLQTKEKTLKIQTARTQHVSSRCTNAASRNGACPCRQLPQKGKKLPAHGSSKTQMQLLFVWFPPAKLLFFSLYISVPPESPPQSGIVAGRVFPSQNGLREPPPALLPTRPWGCGLQLLHTLK